MAQIQPESDFERTILEELKEIRKLVNEAQRDSGAAFEQGTKIARRVRVLERLVKRHRHTF